MNSTNLILPSSPTFIKNKVLSANERIHWLRLIRSETITPSIFYKLLDRYGSAEEALTQLPNLSHSRNLKKKIKIYSVEDAEEELEALEKIGGKLITIREALYPQNLAFLPDAPPLLTALGNTALLNQKTIGIVGTRNASSNAKYFTELLAKGLGENGYCIVSGFARGIETNAHKGALGAGSIAVLRGGVDVVYPIEGKDLYEKLLANKGLIISEEPLRLNPETLSYSKHNRLISGISSGVIVVEAGLRSNSLITAQMALEQGRDVFAVPGFPLDPRTFGTNNLLKDGAILVQSLNDILEIYRDKSHFNPEPSHSTPTKITPPAQADLDKVGRIILNYLGLDPTPVDEILRQCHISGPVVMMSLLELELTGRIMRHPGNQVSLLYSMPKSL